MRLSKALDVAHFEVKKYVYSLSEKRKKKKNNLFKVYQLAPFPSKKKIVLILDAGFFPGVESVDITRLGSGGSMYIPFRSSFGMSIQRRGVGVFYLITHQSTNPRHEHERVGGREETSFYCISIVVVEHSRRQRKWEWAGGRVFIPHRITLLSCVYELTLYTHMSSTHFYFGTPDFLCIVMRLEVCFPKLYEDLLNFFFYSISFS